MTQPELSASTELELKIGQIRSFIEDSLVDREPWIDNDRGGGIKSEEKESQRFRTAKNLTVNCRSSRIIEGTGVEGYVTIIASDPDLGIRSLSFNDDTTLGYSYDKDKGEVEEESVDLEDAKQRDDFKGLVDYFSQAITAVQEPKKDYERYPLPLSITTSELSDKEKQASLQLQNEAILLFMPTYRMESNSGDSWLASQIINSGNRHYSILYRTDSQPGRLSSTVVYASNSQGTWRVLPRIGERGKENSVWHDKGYGGEAVLNLPIALQQTLWGLVGEEHHEQPDDFKMPDSVVMNVLRSVTNESYDVFLAGAESNKVSITEWDSDDVNTQLLPDKADDLKPIFTFNSPMYGEVTASRVSSRDGTINYLILTKNSDGIRWVGMAEPVNAKILKSFILDTYLAGWKDVYEPPVEYGEGKDAGYEDNSAKVAGGLVIRAMMGKL